MSRPLNWLAPYVPPEIQACEVCDAPCRRPWKTCPARVTEEIHERRLRAVSSAHGNGQAGQEAPTYP